MNKNYIVPIVIIITLIVFTTLIILLKHEYTLDYKYACEQLGLRFESFNPNFYNPKVECSDGVIYNVRETCVQRNKWGECVDYKYIIDPFLYD